MANDPNTYYAIPNELVDGAKLPLNIKSIQGAGGDVISLAQGQTYISGPGNNNITCPNPSLVDPSKFGFYAFFGATQPADINLQSGIVSNNGFGGVDKISGIDSVATGSSNSRIIGNDC